MGMFEIEVRLACPVAAVTGYRAVCCQNPFQAPQSE